MEFGVKCDYKKKKKSKFKYKQTLICNHDLLTVLLETLGTHVPWLSNTECASLSTRGTPLVSERVKNNYTSQSAG